MQIQEVDNWTIVSLVDVPSGWIEVRELLLVSRSNSKLNEL
jgi:hypothetical protein